MDPNLQGEAALGAVYRSPLAAAVPAGWFVKSSTTFLAPHGEANVIVSVEPLCPEIDVFEYAQVQGDLLIREFPGFRQAGIWEREVSGLPGPVILREFSWTPPDGVPISQVQMYAVAPDTGQGSRGITATGTTPTTNFARFRDLFFRVALSVVCDQADASAPKQSRPRRSGRS
jgi:hypothetical protein